MQNYAIKTMEYVGEGEVLEHNTQNLHQWHIF